MHNKARQNLYVAARAREISRVSSRPSGFYQFGRRSALPEPTPTRAARALQKARGWLDANGRGIAIVLAFVAAGTVLGAAYAWAVSR